MLLADDLQRQLRNELAVVELTAVTTADLAEALGPATSVAAMGDWLCRALPKHIVVEHVNLHRCFILRR